MSETTEIERLQAENEALKAAFFSFAEMYSKAKNAYDMKHKTDAFKILGFIKPKKERGKRGDTYDNHKIRCRYFDLIAGYIDYTINPFAIIKTYEPITKTEAIRIMTKEFNFPSENACAQKIKTILTNDRESLIKDKPGYKAMVEAISRRSLSDKEFEEIWKNYEPLKGQGPPQWPVT